MGRLDDDDIDDRDEDDSPSNEDITEQSEEAAELAEEDAGEEEESPVAFAETAHDDVLDDYDDADIDLKVVDEALTQKDQNARALAIRRAIEERLESKRLSRDLDYLDLELDD
jgi:hypothetical protein